MSSSLATWLPLLLSVAAYLVGSLSFAVIVSRAMGLKDPRTYGSGNPGATNVLRTGNRKAAALTLLFDALKALIPVALVRWLGPAHGLGVGTAAAVGLAAFLGHLWPVFFRFEGGKGVATALGALLGLHPWLGAVALGTWLLMAWRFRYSSLAALTAAGVAPLALLLVRGPGPDALAVIVMSLLLVWRHRGNLTKLMAGQEGKIGGARAASPVQAPPDPAGHHPHGHRHRGSTPDAQSRDHPPHA